jgi:hypothetical protein
MGVGSLFWELNTGMGFYSDFFGGWLCGLGSSYCFYGAVSVILGGDYSEDSIAAHIGFVYYSFV